MHAHAGIDRDTRIHRQTGWQAS